MGPSVEPRRLYVRDAAVAAQLWGFKLTCRQMERYAGERRLPFFKDDDGRLLIAEDQLRASLTLLSEPPKIRRGSKYR